jgi:hypothetical protein
MLKRKLQAETLQKGKYRFAAQGINFRSSEEASAIEVERREVVTWFLIMDEN